MSAVEHRFGPYGGQYVPETLMPALAQLEEAWTEAWADAEFRAELDLLLRDYAGRPTPLYEAQRLSEAAGHRIEVAAPGRAVRHGEHAVTDSEPGGQGGQVRDLARLIAADATVMVERRAAPAGDVLERAGRGRRLRQHAGFGPAIDRSVADAVSVAQKPGRKLSFHGSSPV